MGTNRHNSPIYFPRDSLLSPIILIKISHGVKVAEFDEIKSIIEGESGHPVLHIRNSKHVAEMFFIPESIEEKFKKGGLTAYSLKDIRKQFQELYKLLGI